MTKTIAPIDRNFGDNSSSALSYALQVTVQAEQDNMFSADADVNLGKVLEELDEIASATSEENRFEEIGDALFALVSVAHFYGMDPEKALRQSADKFITRWQRVYELADNDSLNLCDCDSAMLDKYWQQAKRF